MHLYSETTYVCYLNHAFHKMETSRGAKEL